MAMVINILSYWQVLLVLVIIVGYVALEGVGLKIGPIPGDAWL